MKSSNKINLIITSILILIIVLLVNMHILELKDENRVKYNILKSSERVLVYELRKGNRGDILAATDTNSFEKMRDYYDNGGISNSKQIHFPYRIITPDNEWCIVKYFRDSTIVQLERITNFTNEERFSSETIWVDVRHVHFIR